MISYYKEEENLNATERNIITAKTTRSDIEHSQFEQGVMAYGWGNRAAMAGANILPTRDREQLKNHATVFRRRHPADYHQRLLREQHAANPASITLTPTITQWTDVERSQFEQGVVAYGWGNWAAMASANIVAIRDREKLKNRARHIQWHHPADYQRLLREPRAAASRSASQ
jgi:hypothetical protein